MDEDDLDYYGDVLPCGCCSCCGCTCNDYLYEDLDDDNEFELTDEEILYYDDNCEEFEEAKRARLFEAQEY